MTMKVLGGAASVVLLLLLATMPDGVAADGIEPGNLALQMSLSFAGTSSPFSSPSLGLGWRAPLRIGQTGDRELRAAELPMVPLVPLVLVADSESGPRFSLLGREVTTRSRLDEAGEHSSNWVWWTLGGVAVAAGAIALAAGGGGDDHSNSSQSGGGAQVVCGNNDIVLGNMCVANTR